jgi:hypothetical protein
MNLEAADVRAIGPMIRRAVGAIGLIVGLIFLLGGGFWIHRNHLDQFVLKPAVAEGQVVENQQVDSYRHGVRSRTSYRAIVQFTDRHGQSVKLPDWISFEPPAYYVGQRVNVFYDPQNSQSAMIDRGAKNYFLLVLFGGFGGLMVLGSVQRLAKASA